jgi:hypothetical protein
VPYLTERETFRQVLRTSPLRDALWCINLSDDGQPWLDEAHPAGAHRITQAVRRPKLMAATTGAAGLLGTRRAPAGASAWSS